MIYKAPKYCFFLNLLAVFFILLCVSCGINQTTPASKTIPEVKRTPQIVFLNYNIKKNKNGNTTVTFVNSKKVKGTLKNQKKILDKKGESEDLICEQFDVTSTLLSQHIIKNPLLKTVEYVDDTKNFRVVQMALDSSQFTVRLQLYPETKYVAIHKNNEQTPLSLTKVSDL